MHGENSCAARIVVSPAVAPSLVHTDGARSFLPSDLSLGSMDELTAVQVVVARSSKVFKKRRFPQPDQAPYWPWEMHHKISTI